MRWRCSLCDPDTWRDAEDAAAAFAEHYRATHWDGRK